MVRNWRGATGLGRGSVGWRVVGVGGGEMVQRAGRKLMGWREIGCGGGFSEMGVGR